MNRYILLSIQVVAVALSAFLFASCGKDQKETPLSLAIKQHTLSRKTGYGNDWVYYSFESGKEIQGVNEENRAGRLDWDVAFNRYNNIRTNSGTSGKGKGGARDMGKVAFKSVKVAPTDGYIVDQKDSIMYGLGTLLQGGQAEMGPSTLNEVLKGAIVFSGPPPTYTMSEHVFVIKTANGKYVKMQVEGFHDKEGKSGYVAFRYVYQPDGSPKFE